MELMQRVFIAAFFLLAIMLALVWEGLSPWLIPAPPKDATANGTVANETVPPHTNLTEAVDVWDLINSSNVEDQCLRQAKQYAMEQGYPVYSVYGCECDANESEQLKSYDCAISALDGKHIVEIECVKADERCLFETEAGKVHYPFGQLERLFIG